MNDGKKPIRRVLIANRGEIAVRVIRTLRDRGQESVAVYSDVDRTALHVLLADRAQPLGPANASESYLDTNKILAACKQHNVDAVHPGYGFLSENAGFAETLTAEGITLVGPSASAMRLMGSKTDARAAMEKAGVPVVPGDNGPDGNGFPVAELALAAARNVGFPVLIKAAAGGGGKGMRLVADEKDFAAAFEAAKREGRSSFGDDRVYIERAIIKPRHVEIQVFADQHGNVVHLGERDCSMQRRHQKVIEEAPCPVLSDSVREKMCASAVAAAQTCNYQGAGTVEFLLAPDGGYYFLEMNTRLQVEHPVTEVLYGVDLVAWQLDVAEGKPLPLGQQQLDHRRRGAAIECRIYAEDPVRFLPSPGTITTLRTPGGAYVRDDSGVYEGAEISPYYDPLISKLVVWGESRAQAIARMRRALAEYRVCGIETNLAFHRQVMIDGDFAAARYDTGFIDRAEHLRRPVGPRDKAELEAAIVAAVVDAEDSKKTVPKAQAAHAQDAGARSQWRDAVGLPRWHS